MGRQKDSIKCVSEERERREGERTGRDGERERGRGGEEKERDEGEIGEQTYKNHKNNYSSKQ